MSEAMQIFLFLVTFCVLVGAAGYWDARVWRIHHECKVHGHRWVKHPSRVPSGYFLLCSHCGRRHY